MATNPNLARTQGPAATYRPHDCYLWNAQHTHITPEYISNECGVCGKVTGFMWRKWSKRIRSLFTSEPDHTSTSNE